MSVTERRTGLLPLSSQTFTFKFKSRFVQEGRRLPQQVKEIKVTRIYLRKLALTLSHLSTQAKMTSSGIDLHTVECVETKQLTDLQGREMRWTSMTAGLKSRNKMKTIIKAFTARK